MAVETDPIADRPALARLTGKVALVTGSTSGIGEGISRLFAAEGAAVVLAGRRAQLGERIARDLAEGGHAAMFVASDLTDRAAAARLVERAVERFGKLDVLVNNAGATGRGPTHDFSEEDFDRTVDTNFKGTFFTTKAAIPHLLRSDAPRVINITTIAAHRGLPGAAVYGASKAAIEALTKHWAVEYGAQGLRVNAISPGLIEAPMAAGLLANPDFVARNVLPNIPAGRVGRPHDVAHTALFLATDEADYLSGVSIALDGGSSAG